MQLSGKPKTLLVTGGAGFIGANFVLRAVAAGHTVVNLDALTYAGNLESLAALAQTRAMFSCAETSMMLRWSRNC
jgi:dTDP-D-glucose 4,6-dehydratase